MQYWNPAIFLLPICSEPFSFSHTDEHRSIFVFGFFFLLSFLVMASVWILKIKNHYHHIFSLNVLKIYIIYNVVVKRRGGLCQFLLLSSCCWRWQTGELISDTKSLGFFVFFSQHQFFLSVLSDMNKDDLFLALLTAAAENTVQLVNVKPPAESKVRRRR